VSVANRPDGGAVFRMVFPDEAGPQDAR